MAAFKSIVWDWNGTLLDDVDDAVASLNSMLAKRGFPPVDRAFYRARFRFPSRDFYAEIGLDLAHEDWNAICEDFHSAFAAANTRRLRDGAVEALEHFKKSGVRQFLLSAHREDLLLKDAEAAGIAGYFEEIAGTDNLDGASKSLRAVRLFSTALKGEDPAGALFVGDTLHDAEVAAETGARCLLLTCGHQEKRRLLAAGCPLADSLSSLPAAIRALEAA